MRIPGLSVGGQRRSAVMRKSSGPATYPSLRAARVAVASQRVYRARSVNADFSDKAMLPTFNFFGRSELEAESDMASEQGPTVRGHDCEDFAPTGFLHSGERQDGKQWICPECGSLWEHACSESAGCYWHLVSTKMGRELATLLDQAGEPWS